MRICNLYSPADKDHSIQIIAFVNGNHYVLVKSIKDGNVTYFDQSIGAQGTLITITADQFKQIYSGVILSAEKVKDASQLMSEKDMKAVQGSFFFLIPIFIGIAAAVASATAVAAAVVASAVAAIAGVIAGVGAVISGFVTSIEGMLSGLASSIGGAISSGSVMGTFSAIGQFSGAVSLASFGGQMAAQAFGADSLARVLGTISQITGLASFATTGIAGLANVFKGGFQAGLQNIASSIQNMGGKIWNGITTIATQAGKLISGAGSLFGNILNGVGQFAGNVIGSITNGSFLQSLNSIGSGLVNGAAKTFDLIGQGVVKGMDWLVTKGVQWAGSKLGDLFSGALGNNPQVTGAAQKLTTSQSAYQSLVNMVVTNSVTKTMSDLGLPPTVSNLVTAFAKGGLSDPANFLGSGLKNLLMAGVKEGALNLDIPPPLQAGISAVGQLFVGKLFEPTPVPTTTSTSTNGTTQSAQQTTTTSRDPSVTNAASSQEVLSSFNNSTITTNETGRVTINIPAPDPPPLIPPPPPSTPAPPTTQDGGLWSSILPDMLRVGTSAALGSLLNINFGNLMQQFSEGLLPSASAAVAGPASVSSSLLQDLYVLVNGIKNEEIDPNKAPDYIYNLQHDLIRQSGQTLQPERDILTPGIYQNTLLLKILNSALSIIPKAGVAYVGPLGLIPNAGDTAQTLRDTFKWLQEVQSPQEQTKLVTDIVTNLEGHFGTAPADRDRPIVAMGYSGGLVPLVEAIETNGYNATTLVGLGAATSLISGLSAELTQKIMDAFTQGPSGAAADLVKSSASGIPSLVGTAVKQIVNVWGTNDILLKLGVAGARKMIGGIPTINVEIEGASHFDYMLRSGETDPVKLAFNRKVSAFVTGLLLNAEDRQSLEDYFLVNNVKQWPDGIWRYNPL